MHNYRLSRTAYRDSRDSYNGPKRGELGSLDHYHRQRFEEMPPVDHLQRPRHVEVNHVDPYSRPRYDMGPMEPGPRPRPGDQGLDIKAYLDTHTKSKSIRLADFAFGDEGAHLLRDFLERNKQVESLELRGNNLSSEGFAAICEGLFGNSSLKTLAAEWNNIGSGTRGIDCLAEYVTQTSSLEYLDLRNNKLTTSAGAGLAKIIRSSTSLVTLDLRWNELGNHGAKMISEALEENTRILAIELGGNNVTEDVMGQILSRLERNRGKKGDFYVNTREQEHVHVNGSHIKTQKVEYSRENREIFEDLQRALRANAELERALHMETRKNADLEQFIARELQPKIDHLMRDNTALNAAIKPLEADNVRLNKDIGILQDKCANLESMHAQDLHTIEDCQEHIRVLEQDLRSAEMNYKANTDRLVNEHALKMTEAENSWNLRLADLTRENEFLIGRNRDLEREINVLVEENRGLLFSTDDRIRDSIIRAREEERQKNLVVINDLEIRLRATEEELYRIKREFEDVGTDFARKKDYTEDKLRQANEEIRRLKSEVTINVEYYNKEKLKGESLQNEIMARDNTLLKLESDLRELQKVLHNKEIMYQEQIDILKREHDEEAHRWEETKQTLQRRVADLEKQNRQIQSELNRLRTDMQRLSELLVTNLSQTVYKTFSELK